MYSLHQSMRFIHRWGEFYQTFTVIFTFNCTPRCYPGGGMKRPVVATWGEDSYQNVHKIFLQTFWMEGCLIHTIRSNSTRFKTKHFPRTSLVPSTEHQWHQWSEMSAQILKDTKRQHPPRHSVFTLLPSDNRYTSICSHTTRLLHASSVKSSVKYFNPSIKCHVL